MNKVRVIPVTYPGTFAARDNNILLRVRFTPRNAHFKNIAHHTHSLELHSLAVSFNNLSRKIWSLPRRCYTSILHCVGGFQGIYNTIITRSNKLISSAQKAGSILSSG